METVGEDRALRDTFRVKQLFQIWSNRRKNVTVCITSIAYHRKGFHKQMSIHGRLERANQRNIGFPYRCEFRVLISDDTYVYFDASDVYSIVESGEATFIPENDFHPLKANYDNPVIFLTMGNLIEPGKLQYNTRHQGVFLGKNGEAL